MKFGIYEEFPTEKNLGKLVHVDFPIDIIIASRNLNEFQNLERQIKYTNSSVQRVGYWPVLSLEEGYWMSPFSDRQALERVISELEERSSQDERLLLKWDAELPVAVKPRKTLAKLMAKGTWNFSSNKERIQGFLKDHDKHNMDLFTAEWPVIPEKIQESHLPIEFWYLRLLASAMLFVYVFQRRDLVFFIATILQAVIYIRNISLMKKNEK